MTDNLTSQQVWAEMEKELFGVLGMVTAANEARTVGVVYTVRDHKLYIVSKKEAWKVRHVAKNPHVSMTVPIHKRIPIMPWIKIPAATITFCGLATIHKAADMEPDILQALLRGLQTDPDTIENSRVIEIQLVKEFITYGVGVSLMEMRDTLKARGRVSVMAD